MKDEAKKYGRQWAYPLVGVRFSRFVFGFLNSSFILPHSSLLIHPYSSRAWVAWAYTSTSWIPLTEAKYSARSKSDSTAMRSPRLPSSRALAVLLTRTPAHRAYTVTISPRRTRSGWGG